MPEHIVGMFWNKNEGDILEETLCDAIKHVDSLFVADDGSSDGSWSIITSVARRFPDKIEHIQQCPDKEDKAQRNSLLNKIRERYRAEDSWVQIIESDIFILDTDIRTALSQRSNDVSMTWLTLNGCRAPGEWELDVDTFPTWNKPIREVLYKAHWMERMPYTFRPFADLQYSGIWRPWPRGFSNHPGKPVAEGGNEFNTPILFHVGYRGPTHFFEKWKNTTMGDFHSKYKSWDLRSVDAVRKTVSFFNGQWNNDADSFLANREAWKVWNLARENPISVEEQRKKAGL